MPGKRSKPSPSPQKSSKQNELTLAEKLQVIKASTEGSSANSIAKQFKIGRATVGRILKLPRRDGETVDEIAEAIASEFSPGTSNVPHLSDRETDSDEEGTEATENPFGIRSPKNLEDILGSLEEYCYDTDSACLLLIFQMRKHFSNERIRAAVALRKRQSQTTLDAFLKK